MQETRNLKDTIDRIKEMEELFDLLLESFENDPACFEKDTVLKAKLERLIRYYESPLWMEDFRKDEKGLLPQELKRGVLSEDRVYDFLSEIR